MDGMILYSGPLSLFSRKVEIALAEKALAFERIMVPFTQTKGYSPKNPDVVAANPKAQVPVLRDGELTIYDSTVILEYLEDAYPEPALYPKAAKARAEVRQCELEADEVFLAPIRSLMHRTEPPTADAAKRELQEELALRTMPLISANHAKLDDRLSGQQFLCGAFSVADIATFMTVHWALRLGGPSLSGQQNLRRWYRMLAARPAFACTMAEIAEADRELSHPVQNAFAGL